MSQSDESRSQIVPFDQQWATTVLSWVSSSEELLHWSARTDSPLSDETVFAAWHSDPEITPFILSVENEFVAYGEVWLDEADGFAELGRMIVAPGRRRQGIAKLLIEGLVATVDASKYECVWVRVFSTNVPALQCYKSAGFVRASVEESKTLNVGQRFPFIWMRRPIAQLKSD